MVRTAQSRNDFDSWRRVADLSWRSARLPGAGRSFAERSDAAFNTGIYADGRFLSAPGTRVFAQLVEGILGGTDGRTWEDQHPRRCWPILHRDRRFDDCISDRQSTLWFDVHESRASRDGNALRRRAERSAVPATISCSGPRVRTLAVESGSKCPVVPIYPNQRGGQLLLQKPDTLFHGPEPYRGAPTHYEYSGECELCQLPGSPPDDGGR